MNGTEFFHKLSELDSDLIEEAAKLPKKKRSHKKWYALASGMSLILAGGLLGNFLLFNEPVNTPSALSPSPTIVTNTVPGVFIPKIALPTSNSDNMQMKMVGLIVYQGSIYTQAQSYTGENATAIKNLVGTHIGTAKGTIDEWSTQKDYEKNLASSILGEVYTVKGYDSSFRLCTSNVYEDETGNMVEEIQFFENLNGITLYKGRDLFGNRLHLLQNFSFATYQTETDWQNGASVFHKLSDISKDKMQEFLKEVCKAKFIEMTDSSLYQQPSRHLFLTLNDHTTVELRLFPGGYVGYQALGSYLVKVPGELFDEIYAATK